MQKHLGVKLVYGRYYHYQSQNINLAKFSIIVKFDNFEHKLHLLYYDEDCLNNFKRFPYLYCYHHYE